MSLLKFGFTIKPKTGPSASEGSSTPLASPPAASSSSSSSSSSSASSSASKRETPLALSSSRTEPSPAIPFSSSSSLLSSSSAAKGLVVSLDEDDENEMMILNDMATPPSSTSVKKAPMTTTPPSQQSSRKQQQQQQPEAKKTSSSAMKKRKLITSDDEGEEDSVDVSEEEEEEDDDDSSEEEEDDDDDDDRPKKKKAKMTTPLSKPKQATTSSSANSTPPPDRATSTSSPLLGGPKGEVHREGDHEHDYLRWLNEDLRDDAKRPPSDPNYDPTTLFVPPGYLDGKDPKMHAPGQCRKITDAMRVWWDLYRKYFDCLVCFKVGKFFEMYHRCADVAVKVCNLVYMKGEVAHCGFPERSWGKMSALLVAAGHRVVRVEQMTSAETKQKGMMERQVCQVLSPGTMTLSVRDGTVPLISRDGKERLQLLAIAEEGEGVGVCLVDATTGTFRIGSFPKLRDFLAVRSMLAVESPAEICYEMRSISPQLLTILKSERGALLTPVKPVTATNAPKWGLEIEKQYFGDGEFQPPAYLSALESRVRDEAEDPVARLQKRALDVAVRVLKRALVDDELITMGRFFPYVVPAASLASPSSSSSAGSPAPAEEESAEEPIQYMVLDSQALKHLEIFATNADGGKEGSLFGFMDRTSSPYGSRKLHEWISRPIFSPISALERRQNSVATLMGMMREEAMSEFRRALAKGGDLERVLSRIHAMGSKRRSKNHPDAKAVVYDELEVNISKIKGFSLALSALQKLHDAAKDLQSRLPAEGGTTKIDGVANLRRLLHNLTRDEVRDGITKFRTSYDAKKAETTGIIEPKPGVSKEYDAIKQEVEEIRKELEVTMLAAFKRQFATNAISYWHPANGKERYQLEVPENLPPQSGWLMSSKKKGFKRYDVPSIRSTVKRLEERETALKEVTKDLTRAVFHAFDEKREMWNSAVSSASELDCLISLAVVSLGEGGSEDSPMCRPRLTDVAGGGLYSVKCRHPCVAASLEKRGGGGFIPNDVFLGENGWGRVLILSGANMGGKSTLLRQTCLAAIMAQVGSWVCAQEFSLSVCDRIFTRVGASDRIMEGQSTFHVELSEAATILHHSTPRSLVILDELGRGTSTFDGTAIAQSVVEKLIEVKCMTMFATHYHALVKEVGERGEVSLGRMACIANEGEDELITFLYKLEKGASDKSYGMNVARLARLPEDVIKMAGNMAAKFERAMAKHNDRCLLRELREIVEAGGDVKDFLRVKMR